MPLFYVKTHLRKISSNFVFLSYIVFLNKEQFGFKHFKNFQKNVQNFQIFRKPVAVNVLTTPIQEKSFLNPICTFSGITKNKFRAKQNFTTDLVNTLTANDIIYVITRHFGSLHVFCPKIKTRGRLCLYLTLKRIYGKFPATSFFWDKLYIF